MMKRNDNYLPVPGEEKNLDVDFVNTKARVNESIVRQTTFKLSFQCCWVIAGGVV